MKLKLHIQILAFLVLTTMLCHFLLERSTTDYISVFKIIKVLKRWTWKHEQEIRVYQQKEILVF